MIRSRPWHAAVAAAAGLSLVVASGVMAHGPDPLLGGSLWTQDQVVDFGWRSTAIPPAAMQGAIARAAADASGSILSRAATFRYVASGNPIGYGSGATCGLNGLACFTRSSTGFTMWFREQGHHFDWGQMDWCEMHATAPDGCYQAETIALDEFGHVEGLDHHVNHADQRDYDDAVVQTYSQTKPGDGWARRAFGTCDVAALQMAYDVVNSNAKLSICLHLATTLSLTASPTQIAFGAATTITATLRAANDTHFGQLRSNALSGRSVTLQRRDVGATTWTSVGPMGPGGSGGTYVLTTRPYASSQYRAVFSVGSNDGLIGTTSSTVTVSVALCSTCPRVITDGGPVR